MVKIWILSSQRSSGKYYHKLRNPWDLIHLILMKSMLSPFPRLSPTIILKWSLLLVMPVTNAVSERSFSALKGVKTYLRSTAWDFFCGFCYGLLVSTTEWAALDGRNPLRGSRYAQNAIQTWTEFLYFEKGAVSGQWTYWIDLKQRKRKK